MKKTLSLILALLMTLSCASAIFADDVAIDDEAIEETTGEEAIEDEEAIAEEEVVEEEATPYDKAIQFLANYKIMKGYADDGLLHAEKNVKRYEMALLVSRVATGWVDDSAWEDGPANNSKFTDLAGTGAENYYGILSYADQKGIVEGYEDGTFKPEKTVTYREALTMAVRTLGYGKGLEYPWGFIEKAVGLGLTNGITGVAYTDEINRGVVAQIVYNTLFAETADGDTLAFDSFGVENGWQNIMVVADQRGIFSVDDIRTEVGIAFRIVNADGTLGDEVYYAHNDLQVGRIYKALFVVDGDKNYVSNLTVEAYEATIVENKGMTDDEGKPYKTVNAIGAYLDGYTLVTEYTQLGNTIADSIKTVGDELILAEAYGFSTGIVDWEEADPYTYVINWATGDILKKTAEGKYETEWHWNDTFGYYFKVKENVTISGTIGTVENNTVVGVEIMDEDDMEKIINDIVEAIAVIDTLPSYSIANNYKYGVHVDTFGWYNTYECKEASAFAAYAYLEAYDLDGDDKAEYAIFEEYRLGKLENSTVTCAECTEATGGKTTHASIKLSAITAPYSAGYMYNGKNSDYLDGAGNSTLGDLGYEITYNEQYTPCVYHPRVECAQFVEGYEPIMNANGKPVEGYVIYGVDRASNDIKIIKQITKQGDKNQVDEDSYIATGRVLGYSLYNQTINIDGKDMSTAYPALATTTFGNSVNGTADPTWQTVFTRYLSSLYNQYITYVVVDGAIVYAERCGEENAEWIVVEGIYGIDTDNKVVIRGYSTEDLTLDTYRIEVMNSWFNGDWYWYPLNNLEALSKLFTRGSILQISSYDAENDLYYVDTIEYKDVNPEGTKTNVTIKEADGLFRVTTCGDTTKVQRMSANDKYIIIGQETKDGFKPIYVYEGLLGNQWEVEGTVVLGYKSITEGDPSAVTVLIKDATLVNGFKTRESGEGYFYVYPGINRIPEASYNGAGADYYINGQSVYTVSGYDMITANLSATAICVNYRDLEEGQIYRTIDGVIVDADSTDNMPYTPIAWSTFTNELSTVFTADENAGTYWVGQITLDSNAVPVNCEDTNHVVAAMKGLSAIVGKEVYGYTVDVPNLITGAYWGDVTVAGDAVSSIVPLDVVKYGGWNSTWDTIDSATLIFNKETGYAIVYLEESAITRVQFKSGLYTTAWNKIKFADGVFMDLNLPYAAAQENGEEKLVFDTLTLNFAGEDTATAKASGRYFDRNTTVNSVTVNEFTLTGTTPSIVAFNAAVDAGSTFAGDATMFQNLVITFENEVSIVKNSAFASIEIVVNVTVGSDVYDLHIYVLNNGTISAGFGGGPNPATATEGDGMDSFGTGNSTLNGSDNVLTVTTLTDPGNK